MFGVPLLKISSILFFVFFQGVILGYVPNRDACMYRRICHCIMVSLYKMDTVWDTYSFWKETILIVTYVFCPVNFLKNVPEQLKLTV